jgi:UPF0716 protein FxsA
MRQRLGLIGIALLVTAAVEITLLVLVAHQVGVGVTVLLVIATTLLGGWLLRREGIRAWRSLRRASADGRPVGPEVSDGLVGLLSALLLVIPGFVTDLIGLALLVPPVRRGARVTVRRVVERRFSSAVAGDLFGPRQVRVRVRRGASPPADTATGPGTPIEGEIVD